ncbi:head-to-tail stopper [Sinorhizobium phage StopSmel]|nr:head-to-tail stopper [Sinorhizobium phage StopSmel]
MIAGRLTMRALVERNHAMGKDGWGNPVAPSFQPLSTLKCFVWSNTSREVVDGDKTAMVEDMRAFFALSADIREYDEISAVTDAKGATIIAGRLRVEGPVQRKHTHLEAALKRIG